MYVKKWRYVLVALWMFFIFSMSHVDGAKSWLLTGEVLTIVKTGGVDTESSEQEKLKSYDSEENWGMMVLLRKAAHFIEYFILTLLLINARLYRSDHVNAIKMSMIIAVMYAFFDEAHQLLIPGRTGNVVDVMIDSSGVMVAAIIAVIILRLRKVKTNES